MLYHHLWPVSLCMGRSLARYHQSPQSPGSRHVRLPGPGPHSYWIMSRVLRWFGGSTESSRHWRASRYQDWLMAAGRTCEHINLHITSGTSSHKYNQEDRHRFIYFVYLCLLLKIIYYNLPLIKYKTIIKIIIGNYFC